MTPAQIAEAQAQLDFVNHDRAHSRANVQRWKANGSLTHRRANGSAYCRRQVRSAAARWRRLAGSASRGSGLMQLGGDLRLAGPLGRAVEALPDPLGIAVLNTALAVAVLWAGGFWEPLR